MDFLAPWAVKTINTCVIITALIICLRNVRHFFRVGWRGWIEDSLHIDYETWWLLGALIFAVLMVIMIWAFPCGGLVV